MPGLHFVPMRIVAPALLVAASGLGGCASPPPPPEVAEDASEVASAIDGTTPLRMGDAVRLALRHDPELRAMRARWGAERWRTYQARLGPNPAVRLSADPTEWLVGVSAQIDALLDLGGRRRLAAEAGGAREEQALIAAAAREIAVVRATRLAFLDVLRHAAAQSRTREKQELLAAEASRLSRSANAGHTPRSRVIEAEGRSIDAASEAADAEARRREAESRLNRLVGRALDASLALAPELDLADPLASGAPPRLDLARRPEIALATARLAEHGALLGIAEAAWIPRIEGGPFLTHPGKGEATVAGAQFTLVLPVADDGEAQRGAERATLAALAQELKAAEADAALQVHVALIELQRVRGRALHERREKTARSTELRVLLERARDAGGANDADVAGARLAEIDALLAEDETTAEMHRAKVALAAALGDRGAPHGAGSE